MNFINNPLEILINSVKQLYGDIIVDIQFRSDYKHYNIFGIHFGDPCGCTTFPDDGGTPLIDICSNMTLEEITETLAHEISHVIAGIDAGHGEEWEIVFDRIHNKFINLLSELEQLN